MLLLERVEEPDDIKPAAVSDSPTETADVLAGNVGTGDANTWPLEIGFGEVAAAGIGAAGEGDMSGVSAGEGEVGGVAAML